MSRRKNGATKLRLEKLNEINHIDKRVKRKRVREDKEALKKLMSRRDLLRQQLKTKR